MNDKRLFDAINKADNKFISEMLDDVENRKKSKRIIFGKSAVKFIAAVAAVVVVFAASITSFAGVNDDFRQWLSENFGNANVADISEIDESVSKMILDDEFQIAGVNETFVEKVSTQEDELIVNEVYSIKNNRFFPLVKKSFEGEYEGIPFSFEFCTLNDEISAFNYSSNIYTVFEYMSGHTVYLALDDEDNNTEYILCINLKTKEIYKFFEHKTGCNMVMSPNGKIILMNYRADAYWTMLDLMTCRETRVDYIFPYAHTNEIKFIDDYTIATPGEDYEIAKNTYRTKLNLVDLKTMQCTEYNELGYLDLTWSYKVENGKLKIYNVTDGSCFYVENSVPAENIYAVCSNNDYAIVNSENDEFYLLSYKDKKGIRLSSFNIDEDKEVNIFLSNNSNNLICSNGTSTYIIDISKF